jgi:hypothetical protein
VLVSLTRIGASHQRFAKTLAVVGADAAAVCRMHGPDIGGLTVESAPDAPDRLVVRAPSLWLGTRTARDAEFRRLADAVGGLADSARRAGAALVAPGVVVGGGAPVLDGDTHLLDVLSPMEQEVACNLLRAHVPTLIALTGRGVIAPGCAPERIGSRWLAESRVHLATRFLDSAAPAHLERVKAELRRRDGVAHLDRMDVAPDPAAGVVKVRCVDAAASLAALRATALVLAAIAMRARRLVRDGYRAEHVPQRMLEENRARAVAAGLRARFVQVDGRPGGPGRPRGTNARRTAADAARGLLTEVAAELRNLEAGADELAPILLGIDLARFGGASGVTDDMLLREWATGGDAGLVDGCRRALTDPTPGGPLLREMRARKPGLVAAVLRSWDERIETAVARAGASSRRTGGSGKHPDQRARRADGGPRRGGGHRDRRNAPAATEGQARTGQGRHSREAGR